MATNNNINDQTNFVDRSSIPDNQKLSAAEFNTIKNYQNAPAQQITGSLDDTDIIIDGTKQYSVTIVETGSTRTITANASGHFKGNHLIQRYQFDVNCTLTLVNLDSDGNNTGLITPIQAGTYDFNFFSRINGINLEILANIDISSTPEISTWYVHATNGDDSNVGNPEFPFALRQHAIDQTSEGDQIFLRGRPFSNTEVLTIANTIAILGISRSSSFTNITGAIILDTSSNTVTLRCENVSLRCTTTGFTKSGANTGNVEFRNMQLTYFGDCIFDSVDIRNTVIARVSGNDIIVNGGGTIANSSISDSDINFNGTSLALQDVILEQDLIINSGTVYLEGGTVIKGSITESGGVLVDNRDKLEKEAIGATLAIPFNKLITKIDPLTITGPTEFTVNTTDAEYGNVTYQRVTANGVDLPIWALPFRKLLGSRNYDNTNEVVNIIGYWFDDVNYLYSINQPEIVSAPTVLAMTIEDGERNKFVITFNEIVTGTAVGWTPRVAAAARNITLVEGSGTAILKYTVDGAAITDDQSLDMAYDSGTGDTLNAGLVELETFAATSVTNNTDTTAPSFSSAEVGNINDTTIRITMTEACDPASEPATSAFTPAGIASSPTVTVVNITGIFIDLTLSAAVVDSDTPTIAYTKPGSNFLKDTASTPNETASWTAETVTNNVASGYTFANTHELVIDAIGEGISIINNNCYPSDGAGTDEDVTLELVWTVPTPNATDRVFFVLRDDDDNDPKLWLTNGAGDELALRSRTDATNYIERKSVTSVFSDGQRIHILITKTGEAKTGIHIYVNGVEVSYGSDTSTGTYIGLPTLVGNCLVDFGGYQQGVAGLGEYEIYRQFNSVLSGGEIATLYNSGTFPVALTSPLQAKCVQELLLNNNANADNIGVNGTVEGGATFTTV